MENKILKLEQVRMNNINFSKPTKIKSDIVVPIYYKFNENKLGKVPLLIQVPSLYLNDSNNGKDLIILPLMGKTEQSTKLIGEFFNNLDTTIISNIKKILYELKNEKKYRIDFSNISYKSIVNEIEGDDNEIYINGLIKYKLYNTKEFSTKVFDENKNLVHPQNYQDKIIKGVYIKSIIEINSLVLRDNMIHVYIKPHQLRIIEDKINNVNLENYSFIDSDDENEKEENESEIILNTQTDYLEIKKNSPSEKNVFSEKNLKNINQSEQRKLLLNRNDNINKSPNKNDNMVKNQQVVHETNLEKDFEKLCEQDNTLNTINDIIDNQSCTSESDMVDTMFNSELNNIEEDD